ncbi:hypothetical protein JCM5296_006260 [Sporobolomyces johnsonii]
MPSSSVPSHILELLRPLHPGSTFSLSHERISCSTSSQEYLFRRVSPGAGGETQLIGEAESLKRMNEACERVAPRLVGSGEEGDGTKWILSEWHQLSSIPSSAQARLAELIAQMHLARPSPPWSNQFGFPIPTCCGVTQQDNTPSDSWKDFYSERRIGDLVQRIGDAQISKLGKELQSRVIPALLDDLDIKPSILHGDLWSGNARFSKDRNAPITFDPASYYGHSEADLGITRMFGGYTPDFYRRYHELVPKSEPVDEYEQRLDLYELYHHLNHTLMFGGSYKSGAIGLMQGLLKWADEKGL